MARALVLAIATAGCWHGPVPARHISVRFARNDEFPSPPPRGALEFPKTDCSLDGADAPEIRDAVIAFARANLLSDLDADVGAGFAGEAIETPRRDSICRNPDHAPGCFTEILVTPRARRGQLVVARREISSGRCEWGADNVYCLHVTSDAKGTTVVVEKIGGMIGRADVDEESELATQ
jgi:hypothetical protein